MDTEKLSAIRRKWCRDAQFREKMVKKINRMLPGATCERVREFMVYEGSSLPKPTTDTLIMHVPSGMFRGFAMPYEEAVCRLRAGPERDEELVQSIFNLE